MPMIRADMVHYKGDREHIGIRRRIAGTFPKLDVVLRQHMKGLRASTGHDWTCKASDDNENAGFLGPYYYEIRSKTTDHWFWVIAQCGVF